MVRTMDRMMRIEKKRNIRGRSWEYKNRIIGKNKSIFIKA